MLWYILIIVLCCLLVILRWKKRKFMKLYNQYKTKDIPLPLVGHGYLFIGTGAKRLQRFKKLGEQSYQTGGLLAQWHGYKFYLLVSNPEIAELVMKNCLDKDELLRITTPLLGNGSIFAPVPIWRPRRKLLAPTFSLKNLNKFVDIFAKQSSVMVKLIKENVDKGTFSIWNYFTTYTMDSVCESTLGVKIGAQKQTELPFLKAFDFVNQMHARRLCQPWLHSDIIFRVIPSSTVYYKAIHVIREFVSQIMKSKKLLMDRDEKENVQKPEDRLKTFFELLLESSSGRYGHTELLEETLVIILAGTDTSAVGASFCALMLATHQHIQDQCYEELTEIFGDSNRAVSSEDIPRMKYLDAVIKETLRLYPPVPFVLRRVDKDLPISSDVTLVAGCNIFVSILAIHRNPQYWGEDAEQFRPERFFDAAPQHPAAFMPFSHGPRACLGYQYAMLTIKTALTTLLRNYRLLPADSIRGGKDQPIRLSFEIMMKDVDNFEIQLKKRNRK